MATSHSGALRFSLSGMLVVFTVIIFFYCSSVQAQVESVENLPEFDSNYPISRPSYDGVEQLLVLSDRWIIVVSSNVAEVLDKVNGITGGRFLPAVRVWDQTKNSDQPNWNAKNFWTSARDRYYAAARRLAGEQLLDSPASYAITSDTDSRYGSPLRPSRVGRTIVGLGAARVAGGPDIEYAHYSYLQFPSPMRNGNEYTVTVSGNKRVTFLFDLDKTVSRAIKVNQVGYLPDAPRKFAYLGCHIYGVGPMDGNSYHTFDVVDTEDGSVAYSGEIKLRDANSRIDLGGTPAKLGTAITGENVYEMDLSGLARTGTFFIRIPGVGRSWPFRNAPDVYGQAFFTSCRGIYHQRCGTACEAPYTNWPRIACHQDPVYESEFIDFGIGEFNVPDRYDRFDIVGATTNLSRNTPGPTGGWHDAADWDRNNGHFTVVFDLLYSYELAPEKFTDGQLNIPESGNGVPDVLDEAAYGLRVWLNSMDSKGGVAGAVETNTHPRIDEDIDYSYSRRTRWDSLQFAAAAAQLGQLLLPFDIESSELWQSRARKAYDYGVSPANSLGKVKIRARKNRGTGAPYPVEWREEEAFIKPFLLHANIRFYRLYRDAKYLNNLDQLISQTPPPYAWPYSEKDYSPWIYFGLMDGDDPILPAAQRNSMIKSYYADYADTLVGYLEYMPYRCTWPRDKDYWMSWGASDMTNTGRALLIAYTLTGNQKYRAAALLNFDFMLGANPMGMSWTTGLGYTYPVDIQHEVSETDGIADPVPGITIYGVTGGMYTDLRDTVWRSPGGVLGKKSVDFKVPEVPVWRTWSCHPHLNVGQCEFTIQETISSTLFCSAFLMPDGWSPSDALKQRKPRPEEALHGYWYLP